MQGKNKRDGSRRSRKEEKKLLLLRDRSMVEQISEVTTKDEQEQAHLQLTSVVRALELQAHPQQLTTWEMQFNPGGAVPEACAYDITNRSLSPFDCCVDFDSIAGHMLPLEKLHSDQVFVHSILATGYALHDFKVIGKSISISPTHKTLQHLQSTLALLRVKLQSPLAYQQESIIHAILNLAMLAGGYRQWGASIAHLNGLQKIIRLNGGSDFLAKWPKLRFKLDR